MDVSQVDPDEFLFDHSLAGVASEELIDHYNVFNILEAPAQVK